MNIRGIRNITAILLVNISDILVVNINNRTKNIVILSRKNNIRNILRFIPKSGTFNKKYL